MRKGYLFAALALALAAPAQAQHIETFVRVGAGEAPNRSDLVARLVVPHIFVETGRMEIADVTDSWLYAVTDASIGRVYLAAEGFVAPNAEYLSRSSVGGTVGYTFSEKLSSTNRLVFYSNPDGSKQHMVTTALDLKADALTFGGTIGALKGIGTIGQIRVTLSTPIGNTMAYAANNTEVAEMPWSVWVVEEIGVTQRVKLSKSFSVLLGYARGEAVGQQYHATSVSGRYSF